MASLLHATMLADLDGAAPVALVTDASTTAIGAVLQQQAQNTLQPLTFFSKKMSTAQQNYCAYDRGAGHLQGREAFETHVGSSAFRDLHRPHAADLRFRPET